MREIKTSSGRAAAALPLRYSLAALAVFGAATLSLSFDAYLTREASLALFTAAVLVAARIGGLGPGLAATALSALLGGYLFFRPLFFLRLQSTSDLANPLLFVTLGAAISILCEQLHRALARSRREEERFRLIANTLPQFLWTTRPDGVIESINERWFEYSGVPACPENSDWTRAVHSDDAPLVARFRGEPLGAGSDRTFECRIRRHDGLYHWFDVRVTALRDPDGRILKWFGAATDIQDVRELREAARAEAGRFERIVAATPGVICELTRLPSGQLAIPFASASLRAICDLDPAAVATDASALFDRIVPEDRAQLQADIRQSMESQSLWRGEYRFRHETNGDIWLNVNLAPALETENTVKWAGFLNDVTEQKRQAEALRQAQQRELTMLRTLVGGGPVGLAIFDRKMRAIEVSQRWLDDVGMRREDVIGRCHYDLFPNLPAEWKEIHRRALAGETLTGSEEGYRTPDDTQHWANWKAAPWGDDGETTGGILIAAEDTTEKRRTETRARMLETAQQDLFEHMAESVAYCRLLFDDAGKAVDFIHLNVNPAFCRTVGREDVVGRRASDVFDESDAGLMEIITRVSLSGKPTRMAYFLTRMQSWLDLSVYSSERGSFVMVFEGITARKTAELAAQQWKGAFEQSESGIALCDAATGLIKAINPAYARGLGYTPEELTGLPMSTLYPPEELGRRAAALEVADSDAGHALFESRQIRKDGSLFPVMVDITAVRDEKGVLVSHVKIVHDLTQLKQAEAVLLEKEHTVRALLETAAQGILAVNPEGTIVLANQMTGRMFGYPEHDLAGQKLEVLIPHDFREIHARHQANYFAEPRVRPMGLGIELEARRSDGTRFPIEVSLSCIESQRGPMAIAFVNDITARKQAENEIRELNASLEARVRERTKQLEAVNSELESFSYSVSHDLRAPLRGIDGWSMALLEDYGAGLDERGRQYLARVRSETQRMGLLIDDLLQLSRVTRAGMAPVRVQLSALAQHVASRLRESHPERTIAFSVEPGLEAEGDVRLLEIALTNLFENAVKFTACKPEAHIEFGSAEHNGARGFFVHDNGVGFDSAHTAKLFRAFQRLHKASEYPGTGIGLATVRRVISRHGGDVWAHSEPGQGATFGFTLGEPASTKS